MENQVILEIQNLVKHFSVTGGLFGKEVAKVHAVDGVSFSLEKGKTLGLVGESGCGKSTLGRVMLRLIEPTSGKILFNQEDISKYSSSQMRQIRKNIQLIFQDPFSSLNPRMSVRDILSEPFDIHKLYNNKNERETVLVDLLKEVGLNPEALDRYPHEFSGGQRQRIGIARALALRPQVIICDEPVSALDVSIQSQILNLLQDLQEKYGFSYVFIAHNLAVVEHMSNDVAVMYLGQIVEYAPSESLYAKALHPYTQALISSIPKHDVVEKRVRQVIQGDVPSPLNPPNGCRFHTRCPYVQDICRQTAPVLENKIEGKRHLVACHMVKREI